MSLESIPSVSLSCNRMKTLRTLLLLFAMFEADRRTRPKHWWGTVRKESLGACSG